MQVINAPAKINLALHITGQRDDGLHLLDTIAVFANSVEASDTITMSAAPNDGFSISGDYKPDLKYDDPKSNLVLKTRSHVRNVAVQSGQETFPVHISLEKRLPVASGIGGGSADAAATLIGLHRHWGIQFSAAYSGAAILARTLGADVPMCLLGKPLRATGIGDRVSGLNCVPVLHLVLVNCGHLISTQTIFSALANKDNPVIYNLPESQEKFIDFLIQETRNDLQNVAITACPEIQEQLDLLNGQGAIFSRMSGSGATCFGIFTDSNSARVAAKNIKAAKSDWWVVSTQTSPVPAE